MSSGPYHSKYMEKDVLEVIVLRHNRHKLKHATPASYMA